MQYQTIFRVNRAYTWLHEPLLRRLPDGSLCCAFFTGGRGDGDRRNVVAAIHSDDDGGTWTDVEVLASSTSESCWAPSMVVHRGKAHIFTFTSTDAHRYRKVNRVLSTGSDGRTFRDHRLIQAEWMSKRGVDIRHETCLRDGRVLLPAARLEPIGDPDPEAWKPDSRMNRRYANFGWGGIAQNNIFCVGVIEPDDDVSISFHRIPLAHLGAAPHVGTVTV